MNDVIKLMTCGDVDNGKSTLLGYFLFKNNLIYEDQKNKIKDEQYAHILDGLSVEQEQNITVDVAYRFFNIEDKQYILADCPGHVEYTPNMASGASFSDLSIVVVDITKGLTDQTKHHLKICEFMGIKDFIFIINKMDLIDYSQYKFNEIKKDIEIFLNDFDINVLGFIPISSIYGDNINDLSINTPWYNSGTLFDFLINYEPKYDYKYNYFNYTNILVQGVIVEKNRRFVYGKILNGELIDDSDIIVCKSAKSIHVNNLYINGIKSSVGKTNNNFTFELIDNVDISRGDLLSTNIAIKSSSFHVKLLGFSQINKNKDYLFQWANRKTIGQLTNNVLADDINSIQYNNIILQNDIYINKDIDIKYLTDFIIIDITTHKTIGYGRILSPNNYTLTHHTLWLTGLSGAGKTTIATEFIKNYPEYNLFLLDGDTVRKTINSDLGYSLEDRAENIRRIASIAKLLNDSGINVIVTCISPLISHRQLARDIIGDNFIEVYIDSNIDNCIKRDVKGLYKKANNHEIQNFTGISSPYESPINPDIHIITTNNSVQNEIKKLNSEYLKYLY